MPRPLKAALICGAAPLLLATIIYSVWRLTRWAWLEMAGLFLLVAGFVSVVVGAALLAWHVWREFRATETVRTATWLHSGLSGGVLLANFPAAAIFTLSAIDIHTRYTVRVLNDSGVPIESFVVTGPGVRVELGRIASGERAQRHLRFAGDGSLTFTARQEQHEIAGELEGYVTGGLGGGTTIQMLPGGTYETEKRND